MHNIVWCNGTHTQLDTRRPTLLKYGSSGAVAVFTDAVDPTGVLRSSGAMVVATAVISIRSAAEHVTRRRGGAAAPTAGTSQRDATEQ